MKTFSFFFLALLFLSGYGGTPPVSSKNNKLISSNLTALSHKKLFPEDTLNRFIHKLGKDSMISLINQKINEGESFLLDNSNWIDGDELTIELSILKKQFFPNRLPIAELSKNNPYISLYHLYSITFGDTGLIVNSLDSLSKNKINTLELFKKSHVEIDEKQWKYVNIVMLTYPDRIYFTDQYKKKEAFDLFNSYDNSTKINDRIYKYWKITELNKNCNDSIINFKTQQVKLFTELYTSNNLKKNYLEKLPEKSITDTTAGIKSSTISSAYQILDKYRSRELSLVKTKISSAYQILDKYRESYDPIRLLAYALYADDINLNKHADDLMYLLDAQKKDGSWAIAKKFNNLESNVNSTFYALWALFEFRDKLLNEK